MVYRPLPGTPVPGIWGPLEGIPLPPGIGTDAPPGGGVNAGGFLH